MRGERRGPQPETEDIRNVEVITRILESGSDEELARLSQTFDLSPEKIQVFRHFAQLRKQTIEQMRRDVDERITINPKATRQEMSIGAYLEEIEPQVRDTVINLRQKGYGTASSGFSEGNAQAIDFLHDELANWQPPQELVDILNEKGVKLDLQTQSLAFITDRKINLAELTEIWKIIEEYLPDLDQDPPDNDSEYANVFREKQNRYQE